MPRITRRAVNIQTNLGEYFKSIISGNTNLTSMLDYLMNKKAYLAIGHGDLTSHINDTFKVPSGKYVIFISNPGVEASAHLIDSPVFESKDKLAQFLSGGLYNMKGPLHDAYKRRYNPNSECPNLSIQFFDVHNPNIHDKLGVWVLPVGATVDTSTRLMNPPPSTTVKDVVVNGPPGVYIILSCRRTNTNRLNISVRNLENLYKRHTKRNMSFNTFKNYDFVRARGSVPLSNLEREYKHFIIRLLQNVNVVGVGQNSGIVKNREFAQYRMRALKRKKSSPSPSSRPKKTRKTNIEMLTRSIKNLKL